MTQTWPHLTERSKEDTGVSLYGYVISAFRAVALSDTEQCPVAVLHWLNAYTSEAMRLPDRKRHLKTLTFTFGGMLGRHFYWVSSTTNL